MSFVKYPHIGGESFHRPFASCGTLSDLNGEGEQQVNRSKSCEKNELNKNWTLIDAEEEHSTRPAVKLPMASFNHIAREVLSLEKSKRFYVDILGFEVIPRPPFDSEGYWLYGYGLSLHLVSTTVPAERKKIKYTRIQHFSSALPRVDHIAFLSNDLSVIRETLDREKVYYKTDNPAGSGISQIFFFDPDGNVLEISNCAPKIGEVRCTVNEEEVKSLQIVSATQDSAVSVEDLTSSCPFVPPSGGGEENTVFFDNNPQSFPSIITSGGDLTTNSESEKDSTSSCTSSKTSPQDEVEEGSVKSK